MKAEYINPFILSLSNTFSTMLNCETRRGAITLKQGRKPLHDLSGIIGMSGKAIGAVVVSFSREVAIRAASTLLMCEQTEVNGDVVDAIGEIANMVAGGAKAQLEELELSISLPSVISGTNHEVRFPSEVTPILVPFDTDWGPLTLEVGLVAMPEPALA